jgi:hypothetical protein
MSLNKRIINAVDSIPPSPDPVGVPVGATYVGYGTTFRTPQMLNFGWSGTALYDRKGDTSTTGRYTIREIGMSTPYDITTLTTTTVAEIVVAASSTKLESLVMDLDEIRGYCHDANLGRAFNPNQYIGFNIYYGAATAQNIYFHDSGRYVIGHSTSGGQKMYRREYPAGSYNDVSVDTTSTTNVLYDVAGLVPSGQTSTVPLSISVINQGNNFVLIDTANSLLKIYSLATPYDFTSWTFIRDIAIPTSDTTIVGTQARIFCHSMGGSFFAVRTGETRVHQFEWVF